MSRRQIMRFRIVIVVAALAASLIWTTSALAATAASSGDEVTFDASPGEVNDVTLTANGATLTLHDAGASVTAGSGCTAVDASTVSCPVPVSQVLMMLGDRADRFTNVGTLGVEIIVNGGKGADVLVGGPGGQALFGAAGSDILKGGPGRDYLEAGDFGVATDSAGAVNLLQGGDGNDRLNCDCVGGHNLLEGGAGDDLLMNGFMDGNSSSDRYVGGPGQDTVSYMAPWISNMPRPDTRPRFISLDGRANDGRVGERDNVMPSVERVIGTWGPDTITGSSVANVLRGMHGADTIRGGGGADMIFGGGGPDTLRGGSGADVLHARDGRPNDYVNGGPGADVCSVDPGDTRIGCAPAVV